MKVEQPGLGEVMWDCPWAGHLYDDRFALRNSAQPNVLGLRCVKCGCLIYVIQEQSQIVGVDGAPLAKA